MLKLIAVATFVGTLGLGSVAMAAEGTRSLSWDQFQQACQNPGAFQVQRQPNAIRLTCQDTQLVWEQVPGDNVEMDNSRRITASLSSDKFNVVEQNSSVQMSSAQAACPQLREVQISYTKSFSLSCQEIQDYRGDMNAFCQSRIDGDLKSNKSLATRTETGRVYDLCAAPALVTGKGQPQPSANLQPSGQQGGKVGGGQIAPQPGSGQVGGSRPAKIPNLGVPSGRREMRPGQSSGQVGGRQSGSKNR